MLLQNFHPLISVTPDNSRHPDDWSTEQVFEFVRAHLTLRLIFFYNELACREHDSEVL